MFFLQFIAGLLLIVAGLTVYFAKRNEKLRKWLEQTFLDGEDLLATEQPYSTIVWWLRWVAIPTGVAMIVPSALVWDFIIGCLAAMVYWLARMVKHAHDRQMQNSQE